MYKLHLKDNTSNGFYLDNFHNDIPDNCIDIDVELWEYLVPLNNFKFIGNIENKTYTIDDRDLFVKVENTGYNNPNSLVEKIKLIEEENANLTFLLMESGVI